MASGAGLIAMPKALLDLYREGIRDDLPGHTGTAFEAGIGIIA